MPPRSLHPLRTAICCPEAEHIIHDPAFAFVSLISNLGKANARRSHLACKVPAQLVNISPRATHEPCTQTSPASATPTSLPMHHFTCADAMNYPNDSLRPSAVAMQKSAKRTSIELYSSSNRQLLRVKARLHLECPSSGNFEHLQDVCLDSISGGGCDSHGGHTPHAPCLQTPDNLSGHCHVAAATCCQ